MLIRTLLLLCLSTTVACTNYHPQVHEGEQHIRSLEHELSGIFGHSSVSKRMSFPRDGDFNFNFEDTLPNRFESPEFHLPSPPDHAYPDDEYYGLPFQRSNNRCYQPPLSEYFRMSHTVYDYPKKAIFDELHKKPDILRQIYYAAQKSSRGYYSGHSYNQNGGCKREEALLEGFLFKGGRCWVIYPRYQNVRFAKCRYPRCKGLFYGSPRCEPVDANAYVWAFCERLPYGKRVAYMKIPLPVDCKCSIYTC